MASREAELRLGIAVEQAKRGVSAAIDAVRDRVLASWEGAISAGLSVQAARGLAVAQLAAIQAERWRPLYDGLDSTYRAAVASGWTEGVAERAIAYGGAETATLEWQTVSTSPCPDCDDRNGRVESPAQWRRLGLPGTRWDARHPVCSVAVIRCQCVLVPVGAGSGRILQRVPDPDRPGRSRAG